MRHRLGGVEVRREYAPGVPAIDAWGAELNQVWTNLVENAADALGGRGHLHVSTRMEGDRVVVVEITDDGPGIREEILPRVFEDFFTTKPPGKGAGLGLGIAWRIVVDRHRGDLKVASRPGQTTAEVRLPVTLPAPSSAPR
jgi:signal transduction histidine kinase